MANKNTTVSKILECVKWRIYSGFKGARSLPRFEKNKNILIWKRLNGLSSRKLNIQSELEIIINKVIDELSKTKRDY